MSANPAYGYRVVQHRIAKLVKHHRGLRAAACVLKVDPAYLHRLATGEKQNPSDAVLRKLHLRRVARYEAYP